MTITAEDLRNIIFDRNLKTLAKDLGELALGFQSRSHVLLSGILSECPYVSKYFEAYATSAGLQDKLVFLKAVNG